MNSRDLPYRNSPIAHFAFLLSEALRRPSVSVASAAPSTSGGWLDRLDRWSWKQRQKALDARLAQSTDLADLERRLREIDRAIASRQY